MKSELTLGLYQHYSGKMYRVLFVAYHSETTEKMVVYQGQYDDPQFGKNPVWIRPLSMFTQTVQIDGKTIPRFTYLGK